MQARPATVERQNKVNALIKQGKTRNEVAAILGITICQVDYNRMSNARRITRAEYHDCVNRNYKAHPYFHLKRKVWAFQQVELKESFTYQDVLDKFGMEPVCYLTGRKIDYNRPETYQLDHVIPRKLKGGNTLDNLELICPWANQMKRHYPLADFLQICREIAAKHPA